MCDGSPTCPSYATCRTGRPCNLRAPFLLAGWDVSTRYFARRYYRRLRTGYGKSRQEARKLSAEVLAGLPI